MTCLNSSRVFACQAGSSLVGTVRGSVAATADVALSASRTARNLRIAALPQNTDTLSAARGRSSGDAVTLRQIFRASHFLQPADGPLEFEAAVSFRVETGRLRVRASQ